MGTYKNDDFDDSDLYDDEDEGYETYRRTAHYGWNFYSESRPRHVENGIKVKNTRGAIGETWWSKRWIKVLESFGMGARLTRGRTYARQGQVVSLSIEPGMVNAKVQGSMPRPYQVKIQLKPLSEQEWDRVTEAMAAQAIFAAKLLAGEMPNNIEEAFSSAHLSLFPTRTQDLQTSCTCPDWANPCKHIAAVYYVLADQFDADPFLIFQLRGRSKETLIAELRAKRTSTMSTSALSTSLETPKDAERPVESLHLEEQLATFWQAGEGLNQFAVHPHKPDIEKALLKRLGKAPFEIGKQNLVTLLEKMYDEVAQYDITVEAQTHGR
jgi:uncharacterized Zn finger protein